MPVDYQTAFQEAAAQAKTDIVMIETITIEHSLLPATLRYAKSDKDFVDGADTYTAAQFEIGLPQMAANTNGGMQVAFSDITLSVTQVLDSIVTTTEPALLTYKVFIPTESGPQAEFVAPLEVTNVQSKQRALTISATYPDSINRQIPSEKYTTTNFPGLRGG